MQVEISKDLDREIDKLAVEVLKALSIKTDNVFYEAKKGVVCISLYQMYYRGVKDGRELERDKEEIADSIVNEVMDKGL